MLAASYFIKIVEQFEFDVVDQIVANYKLEQLEFELSSWNNGA
jgi:hypothetical protein